YRLGRTGEHFMEFSIPGFIKQFCTPNALTTLTEYLTDYGSEGTRAVGKKLIADEIARLDDNAVRRELVQRIEQIQTSDARDFYF
ncbi:MAG: [FeFe] hydrogenase H-cluster radical SAM maturase HydG, partial [Desulfobacterales bacterium]|nr:[FeFe] hydrogenase H-cluster radical SAM maturase HydG [Desulfobacterales bacterium]